MRMQPRVAPPDGYRWANGGGSIIGECNGVHLARVDADGGGVRGTICGRYGPATPVVTAGSSICGNCARIARVPRVAS